VPGESRSEGFDEPDDGAAAENAAAGSQDAAEITETDDADDIAAPEGDDPRESAYGLLQRGHDLMRSRHHAQAATVLARAARIEPRKGSILEALGRAYYNSGQHARAAETFETLLDVDPSAHYAHYALGQSLKQLGRVREARTHLRLAVALSPNSRLYQAALDRLGSAPPRKEPDRP
jgi:Flp pilus assembly protein TadD